MRKSRSKKQTLWQTFIRTPGNVQLLLGLGLLAGLIVLLSAGSPAALPPPAKVLEAQTPVIEQVSIAASDVLPSDVLPTLIPNVTVAPEPAFFPEPALLPEPALAPEQPLEPEQPLAKLVVILDDIGYNADAGMRAIQLPAQITFAVIPHTPHGKMLAEAAHRAGRELMLHAPMSNLSGMDLGQGGLTLDQSEDEFLTVFRAALADIPYIKGVNNHTGSELTAAAQPMQWVMQELKTRDLYFVDSMTTRDSVAATTAEQFFVPALRRHVFLDNTQTAEAIDSEFKRAVALAKQQGYAVAIGHPYPETLAYLESALPLLAEQHIEVVPVSVILAQVLRAKADTLETTAAW
ncbi:MAG: divergent polysaccharide deacetylase family protein [Pseudohongiella sp.]|nr:divergent polysaccharide deacetylase family protein [Pseudohongiella sp.]